MVQHHCLGIVKRMSQMHMLELATHVSALDIDSHYDPADHHPTDVYTQDRSPDGSSSKAGGTDGARWVVSFCSWLTGSAGKCFAAPQAVSSSQAPLFDLLSHSLNFVPTPQSLLSHTQPCMSMPSKLTLCLANQPCKGTAHNIMLSQQICT